MESQVSSDRCQPQTVLRRYGSGFAPATFGSLRRQLHDVWLVRVTSPGFIAETDLSKMQKPGEVRAARGMSLECNHSNRIASLASHDPERTRFGIEKTHRIAAFYGRDAYVQFYEWIQPAPACPAIYPAGLVRIRFGGISFFTITMKMPVQTRFNARLSTATVSDTPPIP